MILVITVLKDKLLTISYLQSTRFCVLMRLFN